MRKVYCDKIYPPQEKLLKAVAEGKKLVMQIPRKHGLSYWQKIMENCNARKFITRSFYSPVPLSEIAEYIEWEIKKIIEEFENGKNDEKESC